MILENIKLEQTANMMCDEAALATVAVWLNRRYEMMFSEMSNFSFLYQESNPPKLIGNSLNIRFNQNELFEKFHGIKKIYHETKCSQEVIDIARKEIEFSKPVLTYFNVHYSPWSEKSSRDRNEIYPYLVVGISDNHEWVYCIDIHYYKKVERMLLFSPLKLTRENLPLFLT